LALTFEEKKDILNTYSNLRKTNIKPDKINYYYDEAIKRRKVVLREIRESGNGYIYVGYLDDYKDRSDDRGFINIDKYINNENEFRSLIDKVITSFGKRTKVGK